MSRKVVTSPVDSRPVRVADSRNPDDRFQPHDRLMKAVFSDLVQARAWFEAFLPEQVVHRLELATLRREPGSFVDAALRERLSDRMFSVRMGESRALLYLLLEHQSTPDRFLPLRALGASVRIWDDWRARHPRAKRIPVVLPLVLYHGERPWTEPMELRDLLEASAADRAAFEPYLPGLRIHLTDLTAIPDEEIRTGVRGEAAVLALSMLSMKHSRGRGLIGRLFESANLIADVARQPTGLRALETLLHYWFATADEGLTPDRFRELLRAAELDRSEETIMTLADKLRREGRKEGHAQGLRDAMESNLLRVLETRFGDVPGERRNQVRDAGLDDLSRWFDRALAESDLEAVFGED